MLEKAQFSLPRAGVMVGLCGLVVLGAGWLMNHRDAIKSKAPVHFSSGAWLSMQLVFKHVSPVNPLPPTPRLVRQDVVCSSGRAGFDRLQKEVESLNVHLDRMYLSKFVKSRYSLNLNSLLEEPSQFSISCANVARPIRLINEKIRRQGQGFLQSLDWKERQGASGQKKFEVNNWISLPKQMFTSKSAWSGVPGCLYGTDASTGKRVVTDRGDVAITKFCQSQVAADQALRSPFTLSSNLPGFASLIAPLSAWRIPQSDLYEDLVGNENLVTWGSKKQPVGLHAQLSIDPAWQAWLQELAECFSGKVSSACSRYPTQSEGRYESARVRMAGISVIDVPSGRLVAAASANSPCFEHDKTRIGIPSKGCPQLPDDTVHRPRLPQSITNHALFTHAPPGSLVKPVLMAGILQYTPSNAGLTGLEVALQKSNSPQFLDAFLCRQKLGQGNFSSKCDRPELTLQSAHKLGWNTGCDGKSDKAITQCAMVDLLYGQPLAQQQNNSGSSLQKEQRTPILPVLMGQTLVKPYRSENGMSGYKDLPWPDSLPDSEQRKVCAQSGAKGYVRCRGPNLALISEAYGQGNTLTTPTGVASLLASLANSAQNQPLHYPHLLVDLVLANGQSDSNALSLKQSALSRGPDGLDPKISRQVLFAMEKTLMPGGTAHAACVSAFGPEGCRAPRGVAGKTGTPGDADERSLAQLSKDLKLRSDCLTRQSSTCNTQYPLPRPRYRWYAAVFKSKGSAEYDKAIAVLVHSNWRRSDGRFADDQNAAAEMAMIAIRQFQAINN